MGGSPYDAVRALLAYADGNFGYIDGHCLLDGIDILGLPYARFLNVIAAFVLRSVLSEEDHARMRTMLEQRVEAPTFENWGTSRATIAAQRDALRDLERSGQ